MALLPPFSWFSVRFCDINITFIWHTIDKTWDPKTGVCLEIVCFAFSIDWGDVKLFSLSPHTPKFSAW